MAIIICIETSGQTASVALAIEGSCVAVRESKTQKEHSAFIQPAIQEMLKDANISFREINAVSVSVGPGSYTGLRVGLATAKGMCYALNIPLITLGTLDIMAFVASQLLIDKGEEGLIAPMIDARRNEVFTAVYDSKLQTILAPHALILKEDSYHSFLSKPVYFIGDGAVKWAFQCSHVNSFFPPLQWNAANMIKMAEAAYVQGTFTHPGSAVPYYGKEFYSSHPKAS
jgi:tRNA threonylcarbamoyladenosine biosynthesis protein TsaB